MVKCGEGDFCVTHTLSGHMFSVSRALLKLTDPAKASYRSVNVSLSTDQSFPLLCVLFSRGLTPILTDLESG